MPVYYGQWVQTMSTRTTHTWNAKLVSCIVVLSTMRSELFEGIGGTQHSLS